MSRVNKHMSGPLCFQVSLDISLVILSHHPERQEKNAWGQGRHQRRFFPLLWWVKRQRQEDRRKLPSHWLGMIGWNQTLGLAALLFSATSHHGILGKEEMFIGLQQQHPPLWPHRSDQNMRLEAPKLAQWSRSPDRRGDVEEKFMVEGMKRGNEGGRG